MLISLFGNLRIEVAGKPVTSINTNRLQSLLAYLILHGDTPQPRDRLAFTLWPASREPQARTNLRQLVHSLKRALPAECGSLVVDHFALQWRQDDSCSVDVVEFQTALDGAAEAGTGNDRAREMQRLTTAADLYQDDLLPALYDDWLLPIREEYRKKICVALYRLGALLEAQKDYAAAIPYAERLLILDSLTEPHHQLLIRLHAANNDRASALRAYHQCMRVLRRELGVEPGPATRELFERILKGSLSGPGELTSAPQAFFHLHRADAIVGRAAEWDRLVQAWQTAIENGPRVALISGEPGIGKTRLADELYQSCVRQGYAAARSRCYAGQRQPPYAAIAEWLRCDAVRTGWAKLRAQQLVELARLIPEIGDEFPNMELAKSEKRVGPPENWQRLLFYDCLNAAVAKSRKPMLLYLDDMQWCDPDSLEWLNGCLMSPAAANVLLLGTVRAEETGREHPFTRFLAGLLQAGMVLEIPLERLNAEETAELARRESTIPLQSENVSEIFRATGGNPLFIVETVRSGSQSTRTNAIITGRLAQLTAPAYELAGFASVVGRPFSLELLAKALDWDERSVSSALDELWQRRIIEGRGTSEYDFSHDLMREVTYSELSVVRKRYLHRRVARALAELHASELETWNGQIAAHFETAGMAEQAIEWFQRAAISARQRYADTEAAALLKRALALCGAFSDSKRKLKQELDLLAALGAVLVTTEGYSAPEVGATYTRALDLARQLDDRSIFVVLSGTWAFHVVRGDLEMGRQFSLEFLKAANNDPTPELILAGNFLLGASLFHLGQLEGSLLCMTEAVRTNTVSEESILALFSGRDLGVFSRSYLAHITWHCGDETQALVYASEAMEIARRIRDPFSQTIALNYAAMLHVFRGDSRSAFEHGAQGVELCKRYGFTYYLAMANILTGWARAAEGALSAGLAQLRNGLEGMRRLGAEVRLPFYFKLLAETVARADLISEALAHLSTGLAFASKNREQWAAADLHFAEGELLAAQGKIDTAHACLQRGLEQARRSGSVALQRKLSIFADRTRAMAATERP